MISPDLLKYIRAQKVIGKDDSVIRQELSSAGWTDQVISEAFNSYTNPIDVFDTPSQPSVNVISEGSKSSQILEKAQNLFLTLSKNPVFSKIKPKFILLGAIFLLVLGILLPLAFGTLFNLNKNDNDTKPVEILTVDQLDKLFKKTINSKELEFYGTSSSVIKNCTFNDTYKGTLFGENNYFKHTSVYKNPSDTESCALAGIGQIYSETYWIEDNVYYRTSENDSLTQLLDITDQKNLAQKPATFLTRLFGENTDVKIESANSVENKLTAKIIMKTKSAQQEMKLTMDVSQGFIENIEFTQYPNNFTQNEAKITGTMRFLKNTAPISLPPFAPTEADFLKDSFIDIISFSPISYNVDTSTFVLQNDTEVIEGDYSLKVVRGENPEAITRCSIIEDACREKLAILRETFNQLTPLINSAVPATCQKKSSQPEQLRSEKYAGILSINLYNAQRSSAELNDYSLLLSLNLEGAQKNTYSIRVKVGKEYCFTGQTTDEISQDLYKKFDLFQQGIN
jgi:hypothetical protein